jgi:hypothetical protein
VRGKGLRGYARTHAELRIALNHWK